MIAVWETFDRETLHDGPRGTGKTRGLCQLSLFLCLHFPGCRILWVMKHRVDLTDTVLNTFEQDVCPGAPILGGLTAAGRRKYVFPNGSEILLRGLDDSAKTRSLEVDWVFCFEATNLLEEDYQMMLPLLRWRGIPYKRIVCDTNPGPPQHWLYQRAISGKMRRIISSHKDNPRFWDAAKGDWTKEGRDYYDSLSSLTGVTLARMRDGKWVADENAVFDGDVLLAHRKKFGEEPWHVGQIVCTEEGKLRDKLLRKRDTSIIRWEDAKPGLIPGRTGAEWKLWCDLFADPRTGRPRPDPGMFPVLAADVSWGQGASNSIICVGDRHSGRKIAEFASASTSPEELGRIIAAAGLWFGGVKGHAFAAWEYNGPGKSVTQIVADTLQYPWCYEHTTRKRGRAEQNAKAIVGWVNSRESKIDLALELRAAYQSEDFINTSTAALDETMAWVRYKNGGIGPVSMMEESSEAQQTHGDRTIADMLLWHAMAICPMYRNQEPRGEPGSIAEYERDRVEMADDEVDDG